MYSTSLMSALDVVAIADTLAISFVSAGAMLNVIWTFLLASLVMGLLAAAFTVIQRQRSHWMHNALEQSPRQISAGSVIVAPVGAVEQPAVPALGYAA